MSLEPVALVALVLAAIPAALFLLNLLFYRRTERVASPIRTEALSVLIPARNEEKNIRATLEAVLANRGAEFEIIVLDDHSTDQTAAIVEAFARRDPRVRLESAPPLPPGWCGKQHACSVLARLARNPLLVFIDADVRLAPDALSRMAGFMAVRRDVALASGVPHQALGTFSERLLLPLIHFVLLGYLPMAFMRWTKMAGFSAGCGQLFIARAEAYRATGGHAMIRATLHDGVKLPRLFRRAGYRTDLFDATDLATCRMYHTNGETWRGLGKNATEGLGAPGTILPMTILLLGGQVLPLLVVMTAPFWNANVLPLAAVATALAYLPRLVAVWRFRQPLGSALLHPLGVMALLAIQWAALLRQWRGKPSEWKGRQYGASSVPATKPAEVA
ncbi:MAG: glycosyltransferase [Verrucomicrobia bacterium]|nr:glycosyltransferase [Verrucomicrobiota bacterium]